MDKKDFLYGDDDCEFSLSKLVGKKIVDVIGYPTNPFGAMPIFNVSHIIFDDGTRISLEGGHDTSYIPANDEFDNMDEDTLERLIEE